jgi:hypothetical protein
LLPATPATPAGLADDDLEERSELEDDDDEVGRPSFETEEEGTLLNSLSFVEIGTLPLKLVKREDSCFSEETALLEESMSTPPPPFVVGCAIEGSWITLGWSNEFGEREFKEFEEDLSLAVLKSC